MFLVIIYTVQRWTMILLYRINLVRLLLLSVFIYVARILWVKYGTCPWEQPNEGCSAIRPQAFEGPYLV